MTAEEGPLSVVGVGNTLYRDEGVGVYAAHYLRRAFTFTPKIEIADGALLGFSLMVLVGIVPSDASHMGMGLTSALADAFPRFVDAAAAEIRAHGVCAEQVRPIALDDVVEGLRSFTHPG
jgi:Ni,Fe-hydrogenase maturation factor